MHVTGGDVVGHRVPDRPDLGRPRRGPAVERGNDCRFGEGQLVAEQLAEQPVVAEPVPPGVDRAEEDAGALRAVEEGCGVGRPVTAWHDSGESRRRMEVRSTKSRRSAGSAASTSVPR